MVVLDTSDTILSARPGMQILIRSYHPHVYTSI